MLRTRNECGLFVVLYLFLFSLAARFLPPDQLTPLIVYQYIASPFVITLLFAFVYRGIRNNVVRKRIRKLQLNPTVDQYVTYVCRCARNKPKLSWIQVEKVIALALAGRVVEFQETRRNIQRKNLSAKDAQDIESFAYIFAYFSQEKIDPLQISSHNNSYLGKAVRLIDGAKCSITSNALESMARELIACPFLLYRSLGALVLSNNKKCTDEEVSKQYMDLSLSLAPSPEIHRYILCQSTADG